MATHDLLDEPLYLGGARGSMRTTRNRTMLAPLTNLQSNSDGTLSDDEFVWLKRRAGGFGIVSTCASFVSEQGHAWDGQLGIAHDKHIPGLQRLADMFRSHGATAIAQLHHGGAVAHQAPERISADAGDGVRAATAADLDRVVDDYKDAARRAIDAGFDGVEVHGANGYLFTQFLSPAANHRGDRWGGDIAGRARLIVETTRAVREAIGAEPILSVRISPVDIFDKRGLVLDDAIELSRMLAAEKINMLHLSLQNAAGEAPFEPGRGPVVAAIRAVVPKTLALAVAGGVTTRSDGIRAREVGADIVVLGRTAIAHPDWPVESRATDFKPIPRPYTKDHLRSVAVSESFLGYLNRFAGLVEGGAPPRG